MAITSERRTEAPENGPRRSSPPPFDIERSALGRKRTSHHYLSTAALAPLGLGCCQEHAKAESAIT